MSAQEETNPGEEQSDAGSRANAPTPGSRDNDPLGSSPPAVKKKPEAAAPSNGSKGGKDNLPAEICVVIGGSSRNTQTLGSYSCGICGKKYKYYNCFQTHVRAHRESESDSREGGTQTLSNNFRYTCDICGKKYKYYSCFQEHRDLHAVDDPYEQVVAPGDDPKEEEQVEPFQKIGPKTGSYVCDFCGKQYKYFNPFQEHVALHAPMRRSCEMPSTCSQQHSVDHSKQGASRPECSQMEKAFCQKSEGKLRRSVMEAQSAQDSRESSDSMGTGSLPVVPGDTARTRGSAPNAGKGNFLNCNASMPTPRKPAGDAEPGPCPLEPYTCGACGIQFQFYNNLLEHMQSHAADNENHVKVESPKAPSSPASVAPPAQRNHSPHINSVLPEKERQQVAERLLRVMCADPGALNVLSGKDFLKLAQTLVDTGARHGAYSLREALGDVGPLALKQLPRMYNQVKVRVTCALGSNASLGIAVTCHSQTVGPDTCCVLTAYQAEGVRLRRYVLGVRDVGSGEGVEHLRHWVQNVLSEFVMSEIRTIHVTEPGVVGTPFLGRAGMCLSCAGCSLGSAVQAVLSKRSLAARGLHELAELLAACRDLAGTGPAGQADPLPPCWDHTAESLLLVHGRFEQIREAYGRSKRVAPLLQSLNKHLLGVLASLLSPLRQAAAELSAEGHPTLQLVLPIYLRLEKLFTGKAAEAGPGSKLCHYFLEALKEHLKVERVHQAAMVLDPQLKLRLVPAYQHEEVMGRVCEAATEMKETGNGGGPGQEDRDGEGPSGGKRGRMDGAGAWVHRKDEQQVRNELLQYLAEPLLRDSPDLFQYWSSAMEKYPKLARLALWLLVVPAVGVRSECMGVLEQALALKRRRLLRPEEMNKLIFLKSNMA